MVLSLPGLLPKAMALIQLWAEMLISVTSVTTEGSAASFSLGHYATVTRTYSRRGMCVLECCAATQDHNDICARTVAENQVSVHGSAEARV